MNPEMSRVVDGLRDWRGRYGNVDDTSEARLALKVFIVAYEPSIRAALEIVDGMSEAQMLDLLHRHNELNIPGGVVVDYARYLVDAMLAPDEPWFLSDVDDHVNVLKRVVEYAQYA